MEMLKSMAGVALVHVPYKRQAPAMVDQISGRIETAFNTAITVMPHVRAGKLRALAVSTMERFPPLPALPSVDEAGVKGFDGSSWQGAVMPAGTPPEIVAKLYQELSAMLKAPATRERFLGQGAIAPGITPKQFQQFVRRELDKWGRVARGANVRLD
ncbi:MAG: hypothetical protein IT529_04870 [Burkholderiales bacterium]|nr:hypothetical protein [Burkholderiales bacterium]